MKKNKKARQSTATRVSSSLLIIFCFMFVVINIKTTSGCGGYSGGGNRNDISENYPNFNHQNYNHNRHTFHHRIRHRSHNHHNNHRSRTYRQEHQQKNLQQQQQQQQPQNTHTPPLAIKKHNKRCRYTDHDIELANNRNALEKLNKNRYRNRNSNNQNQNQNTNYRQQGVARDSNNLEGADDTAASLNSFFSGRNSGQSQHHQHKVRDQFRPNPTSPLLGGNHNQEQLGGNYHQHRVETELMFVDVGQVVNLTCRLHESEVDWHFKDENLTTTVLSYGPMLQVTKQITLVSSTNDRPQFSHHRRRSSHGNDGENGKGEYTLKNENGNENEKEDFNVRRTSVLKNVNKYRVRSDGELVHELSLYVQGVQDQGYYQCIDSKSENPVRKTIHLVLKNNSRALTSGFAKRRLHSSSNFLLYGSMFFISYFVLNHLNVQQH